MSPFTEFLESLFDNGRVKVITPEEIQTDDRNAAEKLLLQSEAIWRLDQPMGLPEFNVSAGMWSAELLFRSAQFQVFRDVNPEAIQSAFKLAGPDVESPSSHYSVDLCFRYLGDVLRMSNLASSDDPLNDEISQLLSHWPLSAIGVKGVEPPVRGAAFKHQGLWRMFIDRVIAKGDARLMADPQIQQSIEVAVGAFPELVPACQKQIEEREKPSE